MKAQDGFSIVAAGFAASGMTGVLAAQHENELLERYWKCFAENAKNISAQDERTEEIFNDCARNEDRIFFTEGRGVYDTLWTIGEAYDTGLIIDALKIPIRTETVEVCELLDEDPFSLPSGGIAFIVTDAPVRIRDAFTERNCPAQIVGRLSEERARIFLIGERKRYLTRPAGGCGGASGQPNENVY